MKIRKGTPQDMPDVLALITELAVFEKEPDAVVISTEDLVRDGFSENPLWLLNDFRVTLKLNSIAISFSK